MPTDSISEKKKRSSASNSEGRDVSKRRRTSDDEGKSEKGSSRRDKGESGKSHKRSKRHSDEEKKSKEKHKSKDSKHSRPSLKPHELSGYDYFSKNNEFATWLKEDKGIFFSDLSSERARELFSDFVKRWNKDKLKPKYYEGIATAPRTAHNWKIRN